MTLTSSLRSRRGSFSIWRKRCPKPRLNAVVSGVFERWTSELVDGRTEHLREHRERVPRRQGWAPLVVGDHALGTAGLFAELWLREL
jgi:hypothetical protein